MIASLHIQTLYKNGITYLGETYFNPPFKIANITEDKKAGPLGLMLMNSSPGILDEDEYAIRIDLAENSVLRLHTQSYQRLFRMKKGAVQSMEVRLGKHSSFIYLPHPVVPHEESIFKASNKIYLDENSTLTWGEVLTCGRKLNGEVFQFSKYHNTTAVYRNDRLIIKENLLMQPALIDPTRLGQLEGFTHQASLICINNENNNSIRLDEVHEYLLMQSFVIFGVTATAGNGILIRILGNGAEKLHSLLKQLSFLLQQPSINKPATAYAR